jgi:osmotically inducible protein OsmC
MTTRTATARWSGALSDGSGAISTETGTLSETPYSFDTRFGDEGGKSGTNPEELLGAAHAGCFTMQLSHNLAEAGHPPERAETRAEVHLKQVEGGFEIPSIHLVLTADVPGISDDEFQRIATDAKENCPLSKVLRAADITLDATLTSS